MFAEYFSLNDGVINAYDSNGNLVAVSASVATNGLLTFVPSGAYVTGAKVYTELVSCELYFAVVQKKV